MLKGIAKTLYQIEHSAIKDEPGDLIKGTNKIQNRSKIALSKGIGKGYGSKFLVRPHKKYKHRLFCNQF